MNLEIIQKELQRIAKDMNDIGIDKDWFKRISMIQRWVGINIKGFQLR